MIFPIKKKKKQYPGPHPRRPGAGPTATVAEYAALNSNPLLSSSSSGSLINERPEFIPRDSETTTQSAIQVAVLAPISSSSSSSSSSRSSARIEAGNSQIMASAGIGDEKKQHSSSMETEYEISDFGSRSESLAGERENGECSPIAAEESGGIGSGDGGKMDGREVNLNGSVAGAGDGDGGKKKKVIRKKVMKLVKVVKLVKKVVKKKVPIMVKKSSNNKERANELQISDDLRGKVSSSNCGIDSYGVCASVQTVERVNLNGGSEIDKVLQEEQPEILNDVGKGGPDDGLMPIEVEKSDIGVPLLVKEGENRDGLVGFSGEVGSSEVMDLFEGRKEGSSREVTRGGLKGDGFVKELDSDAGILVEAVMEDLGGCGNDKGGEEVSEGSCGDEEGRKDDGGKSDQRDGDLFGKVDSVIDVPMETVNVDVAGETNDTAGDEIVDSCHGNEEGSRDEVEKSDQRDEDLVGKPDSAIDVPMEMVGVDLVGKRSYTAGDEIMEGSLGDERGRNNDVGKSDSSVTGTGGMVLSGELDALDRQKRRKKEIFIGGLSIHAKEEDVRKVFEDVGEVAEVRLVTNNRTGRNKGYAFLRYASAADAKKALEKYPTVEICGKQCATEPVQGNDTIYLGNIDKHWKNEDVIKLLQEIGIQKIDKVTVLADPNNAERNRGFAFLELETNKDAQIAFKKLHKKDLVAKLQYIKVAWAEPLTQPDEEELLKVKTVYVEYLPLSWDEEKVRNYFKRFGEIEKVTLAHNLHFSRRKDFAFVNFKTREAALACIGSFNQEVLSDEGSKVSLKVSLAKPLSKGKPNKNVPKSNTKGVSKHKLSPVQRPHCSVEPVTERTSTVYTNNEWMGDTRSSQTFGLEQILAERAFARQMQGRLGAGLTDRRHSFAVTGIKRQFSALGDDLHYSNPRGYPHMRVDGSFSSGSPRHSGGPPGASPYSQQFGPEYVSGYRYPNYPSNFQREEPSQHGRVNLPYRY